MRRWRGTLVAGTAVLVALLLPAGVFAAVSVGGPGATTSIVAGVGAANVGAASVGVAGVPVDQAAGGGVTTTLPTVVTPPVPAVTPPHLPVPTTAPRAAAPGTTVPIPTLPPVPPGGPPLWPPPPPPTVPTVPVVVLPPGTWAAASGGVDVRVRMEPVAPKPGDRVTFSVDITTSRSCCVVDLDFGDGSASSQSSGACDRSIAGTTQVITHVYGSSGAYAARLIVATIPCITTTRPDGSPVLPNIYGPVLHPCVVVGPTPTAKSGC